LYNGKFDIDISNNYYEYNRKSDSYYLHREDTLVKNFLHPLLRYNTLLMFKCM